MIFSFINICKVPWEMLKTTGFALRFQHLPRDHANVNEWKIMFDPYIETSQFLSNDLFTKQPTSPDPRLALECKLTLLWPYHL